jgi:hypothetical protein
LTVITVIIIVATILNLGWYPLSHYIDHKNIYKDIEGRGGQLVTKRLEGLFGGWGSSWGLRRYHVWYVDSDGNMHKAYCKTGIFDEVTWINDYIVKGLQAIVPQKPS